MNPYLDPRKAGPLAAAGNWVIASWCVVEAACIWLPGAVVRVERGLRQAWEGRDG